MKLITFILEVLIYKNCKKLHNGYTFLQLNFFSVSFTVKLYKFIRNFISEFLITYPDKGYHKHQIAPDCLQITMKKNSEFVKYIHNGC